MTQELSEQAWTALRLVERFGVDHPDVRMIVHKAVNSGGLEKELIINAETFYQIDRAETVLRRINDVGICGLIPSDREYLERVALPRGYITNIDLQKAQDFPFF